MALIRPFRGVRPNDALAREVAYLRSCVPPTHPSHYGYEAWEERLRAAVQQERADLAAWLRLAPQCYLDGYLLVGPIERGEHRREEEK